MRKRYIILIIIVALLILLQCCFTMRTSDRRAISDFQKKGIALRMHTLHINGHHLHYALVGADSLPTIVFVHGSPGSWNAFEAYMQDSLLLSRFRMISVDRPGFGYSGYGDALPLQQECDLISSMLDSVQNGKALYLVGHSLGGSIVPVLAADNPRIVSGIVILAGALDPALEPEENWRRVFTWVPFRYLMPGAMRPSNDELWYFKKDVLKLKDKLPLIKCPVYIIHARNDMLVDVRNVAYMKRTMTGAAVVTDTIFPDGNHFIPWNHEEYITRVLYGLR